MSNFLEPNFEEEKFIAEIREKWTRIVKFKSPLSNTDYAVYLNPEATMFVGIHEHDNEIYFVENVETGEQWIPKRDVLRVAETIWKK